MRDRGPEMIEGISAIGATALATPSAGRSMERRQRRLKWLSSLRAAGGSSIDAAEAMGDEVAQARARITDALSVAGEMRGEAGDTAPELSQSPVSVSDVAARIAASADRSLAAQAHVGAAAARHYVDGGIDGWNENQQ
jgi:hypothetical protein